MTERFYPPIDEDLVAQLKMVRKLVESDADYLTDPECPYSGDVKAFLYAISGHSQVSAERDEADGDLLTEINKLRSELREFGNSLDSSDTTEKNTYFRLSVALLEKLTTLQERAAGVKMVQQFTDTVLTIMEDELTPDQRTSIMKRLREITNS